MRLRGQGSLARPARSRYACPMARGGDSDGKGAGEEGLFASIRHSPIAAIVTDYRQDDNPIVAVNEAFCTLTGYSEADIMGRNCRFLAGEATEEEANMALRDAIAHGRPALVELTNYRKDGTPFRNAVMLAPVMGEDGAIAYFIGSQMEVEAPLRSRAATLVAALTQRQRDVLRHMIHGFRNKQIAGFVGISEKTVKMHRARLLAKLGAATSADAIRIGVEAGLQH